MHSRSPPRRQCALGSCVPSQRSALKYPHHFGGGPIGSGPPMPVGSCGEGGAASAGSVPRVGQAFGFGAEAEAGRPQAVKGATAAASSAVRCTDHSVPSWAAGLTRPLRAAGRASAAAAEMEEHIKTETKQIVLVSLSSPPPSRFGTEAIRS